MSHTRLYLLELPEGFTAYCRERCPLPRGCYGRIEERKLYAVQFHPEVEHTAAGQRRCSGTFLFQVLRLRRRAGKMASFAQETIRQRRRKRSAIKRVLVRDCPAAWIPRWQLMLVHKAIGKKPDLHLSWTTACCARTKETIVEARVPASSLT